MSALGIKMAGGSRGTTQKSLSSEYDDEESESESDSEGDSHKHELQQVPASTVHVDDCSDIQVGPRLTYNGPVTVNQIVQVTGGDGGCNDVISQQRFLRQTITAPANSADPLSSNDNENLFNSEVGTTCNVLLQDLTGVSLDKRATSVPKKPIVMWLMWVFIGIISFTIVCSVIAFAIQNNQHEEPMSGFDPDLKPARPGPIQLHGGHYIYSKQYWGGINATSEKKLVHPTPVVVISHTATPQCNNFDKCSEAVQQIQLSHIGKRGARTGVSIVDIGYNFLIGGDGNVYEGRGWDVMSFHRKPEGVLGISFIGNYYKYELTYGQIEAAQELIALGVKLEKLSPSYILIAHNQTMLTNSPGQNVVKVIEKWPHWLLNYRIT